MKFDEMTDLQQLDAVIARTNLEPIRALSLKLSTILQHPNLHEPFLVWIQAYCQEHSQSFDSYIDRGSEITQYKIEKALEHMGLSNQAGNEEAFYIAQQCSFQIASLRNKPYTGTRL